MPNRFLIRYVLAALLIVAVAALGGETAHRPPGLRDRFLSLLGGGPCVGHEWPRRR